MNSRVKKMNSRVKKLWIADLLRSGIRQGKQKLSQITKGQRYDCCLGRLCWLAVAEGVIPKPKRVKNLYQFGTGIFAEAVLPLEVMHWAAIDDAGAYEVSKDGELKTLAIANDTGKSFKEIAKIIHKYL